jgi:hypothetical protein
VRVCVETLGDLLPPSPPAEKATARQDQAGKASTSDGAGDGVYGRERVGPITRAYIDLVWSRTESSTL